MSVAASSAADLPGPQFLVFRVPGSRNRPGCKRGWDMPQKASCDTRKPALPGSLLEILCGVGST